MVQGLQSCIQDQHSSEHSQLGGGHEPRDCGVDSSPLEGKKFEIEVTQGIYIILYMQTRIVYSVIVAFTGIRGILSK